MQLQLKMHVALKRFCMSFYRKERRTKPAENACRIWHSDFVRRAGTTRRIVHALFLPSGDYRTTRHIGHAHFARRAGTTRRIGHALSARRAGTTRHVALTKLTPGLEFRIVDRFFVRFIFAPCFTSFSQ